MIGLVSVVFASLSRGAMPQYLSLYSGKIMDRRPPADSDWVIELDVPDKATLKQIRKAATEAYRVKKNRAEWWRRFSLLKTVLIPYVTGR